MKRKRYKLYDKYDQFIIEILKGKYISNTMRKLVHYDVYTFWHCVSVAKESVRIADSIGLDEEYLLEIAVAGLLHDIGKLEVPIEIIHKPGNLTDIEFDYVKMHPLIGADMVCKSGIYSERVIDGIRHHHMNINGTGYGGSGDEHLNLCDRIIRITDSFDAMTDNRPYHKAYNNDFAMLQLKKEKGISYDPMLLDVFIRLKQENKI